MSLMVLTANAWAMNAICILADLLALNFNAISSVLNSDNLEQYWMCALITDKSVEQQ